MANGKYPLIATRRTAERVSRSLRRKFVGVNGVVTSQTDDVVTIGLARPIGASGGARDVRRMGRVVGYFSGAFGAADSGFRVRPINIDGTDSAADIDVFVTSYGDNAAVYGQERLSRNPDGTGGCFPSAVVGSTIWYAPAQYAGQVRMVADGWYQRRGC